MPDGARASCPPEEMAEYMATHVLACTGHRVDASWSAEELLRVFCILPAPRVSLALWRSKLGVCGTGVPPVADERAVAAHNSMADEALQSAFGVDFDPETGAVAVPELKTP